MACPAGNRDMAGKDTAAPRSLTESGRAEAVASNFGSLRSFTQRKAKVSAGTMRSIAAVQVRTRLEQGQPGTSGAPSAASSAHPTEPASAATTLVPDDAPSTATWSTPDGASAMDGNADRVYVEVSRSPSSPSVAWRRH